MTPAQAVEIDQFLPHPPDRVWRALTDPTLLSRWLMPNDFRPRAGHHFTLGAGLHGLTKCQILEIHPERLLRISWRNAELDTTVTWRLQREGTGTRLFVIHDGFDASRPAQSTAFETMNAGWRGLIMCKLERVLDHLAPADESPGGRSLPSLKQPG